uniref:Division initiation protein n=1 Tax=uncultured Armatimonadetes bacterium TaxID=157466 RepID=A0A6J4IUV4_9BACT|nr:Division initiation protein [uncultured Armatimonadetes bacterium]
MSVFTSQIRNRPWVWQVTALGVVLGGLLAASLKTQDRIRQEQLPTTRISGLAAAYSDLRDTVAEQKKKIADIQASLIRYQKAAADGEGNARLLSESLQKANLLSGLVAVTGPGVVITLQDSTKRPPRSPEDSPETYAEVLKPYIIHDQDIQAVLNELRAAGAEAIVINDQRVIATTAVRCVGPTILVNNIPTNGSPVKIKAIGDPDTLVSSMTMANGVQDAYKMTDPSMFSIDKADAITLPAYAGPTPLRYAREAPKAEAERAQKQSEEATQTGL